MAKEMMIVFVYDTAKCQKDFEDPVDAVLYFHPAWVSPTQRLALVGQLMGVHQFLKNTFSAPSLISLQGGKFVLKQFGTYILAVGTDRNIKDWIIERRGHILESLIKFFHCDFDMILASFGNDRNKFIEKLYQIFEIYLPMLQYSSNLFSNIPILKLPRSASNVFLEAIQMLQYCQETNGILGGAMFHNNKVIASQFSTEITKLLVITDPYRVKVPADNISTNFNTPAGVQLFRIYIPQRQFSKMSQDANLERTFSSYLDPANKKSMHKKNFSKSSSKDHPLLKRDKSIIFTVPEDVELDSIHYKTNNNSIRALSPPLHTTAYSSPAKKITTTNEKPKYQHPLTPSVCSTPLKDINRVLHGFAVSICSGSEEEQTKIEKTPKKSEENLNDIPDVVKEALRCKRLNKLKNPTKVSEKIVKMDDTVSKKSSSVPNLSIAKKIKRKINYTIADPLYPVFRSDGVPVSQFLYDRYMLAHYEDLDKKSKITKCMSNNLSNIIIKNSQQLAIPTSKKPNQQPEVQKLSANKSFDIKSVEMNKSRQETYRRSMSLPLKPLNILEVDDKTKVPTDCLFAQPQRRKLEGLQLTPLMSKLSLLADERTSGYCNREATPSEFRDISSFGMAKNYLLKNKRDEVDVDLEEGAKSEAENKLDEKYEMCDLFLCGHQNMILFLLMERDTALNADLMNAMWSTCVETLGRLESKLQQSLEPLPSQESKEMYSVLSVDADWDTVHRSGLWGVTELDIASSIHDRFINNKNFTDLTIRTDDTIVYANRCGKMEVFYQQALPSNSAGGLPPPTDLMGTIPLKAKRRLERDHSILIL